MIKRKNTISGAFAWQHIEMLESPAWRALTLCGRAVVDRIQIEHGHHGGNDNGQLPVTKADFERYGINPKGIAGAVREAVALGFIEVTSKGSAGNAGHRRPSLYRLTFRPGPGYRGDGTHEWKSIKTDEEARTISLMARANKDADAVRRSKLTSKPKTKPQGWKSSNIGGEKVPRNVKTPGVKTTPTRLGPKNTPTIYISGREALLPNAGAARAQQPAERWFTPKFPADITKLAMANGVFVCPKGENYHAAQRASIEASKKRLEAAE